MKKTLILIVITLFSVIGTNAQKSVGYVSLANSSNDPAQYLINNFENQKAKYIGQPLSKILNDLELKISTHSAISRVASGMTGRDKRYIAGINLNFYDMSEFRKKTNAERKTMKFYAITIYTKELLLSEEYYSLIRKNLLYSIEDLRALYAGKNYLVDKIEVTTSYN